MKVTVPGNVRRSVSATAIVNAMVTVADELEIVQADIQCFKDMQSGATSAYITISELRASTKALLEACRALKSLIGDRPVRCNNCDSTNIKRNGWCRDCGLPTSARRNK